MMLQSKIDELKQLATDNYLRQLVQKFEQLEQDIAQDLYSFVIVGEFSSGKSTFINALMEDDILPTGITPTTATINVIQYADTPAITVHYTDKVEALPYSEKALAQFTANEMTVSTVEMTSMSFVQS